MCECTMNAHEGGRGGTARNKFQDTLKDYEHTPYLQHRELWVHRMSRKSPDFTQKLVNRYLQMVEIPL